MTALDPTSLFEPGSPIVGRRVVGVGGRHLAGFLGAGGGPWSDT